MQLHVVSSSVEFLSYAEITCTSKYSSIMKRKRNALLPGLSELIYLPHIRIFSCQLPITYCSGYNIGLQIFLKAGIPRRPGLQAVSIPVPHRKYLSSVVNMSNWYRCSHS